MTAAERMRRAGVAEVLEDKRAELERQLTEMAAPPDEAGGISFGKRVGEGTSLAVDRLVQTAAHEQLQAVLADVNRALDKVAEDNYGSCDRCGTSIPSERLEALPWAVLCVRCAARR